jgi:hypothetical protein
MTNPVPRLAIIINQGDIQHCYELNARAPCTSWHLKTAIGFMKIASVARSSSGTSVAANSSSITDGRSAGFDGRTVSAKIYRCG